MAKRAVTPGRRPGQKNLVRVDGGYRNQHGVVFTEEQRKALERAVNRSNYKRKQLLAEADMLDKSEGQLKLMGKEPSFIISHQRKNMQGFKSLKEYEQYMDKQARIQSGEYMTERARMYKRNFTNSLLETYGPEAMDIVMKVRTMNPNDYMRKVADDERLEISYVPSDMKVKGRLNQLRAVLGMKLKDEDVDEFYEIEDDIEE